MPDYRVASRYAKSLLDLGIETNIIDTLYDDICNFKEALSNRDLFLLVKSPIIKADKKIGILNTVFGERFNKVTMSFFDIITRKGRENFLPEITDSFISLYKKYKHITTVHLTTATPITESAMASIKRALQNSKVTDQQVEIETSVDPDLIGGFVIEMDDKLYDASVAHKLDEVKKQFLNNKYIKSF
ncbi:MAG: ATP synthase F1 subunit delta [Bacteroidia bacterium]|nr:ATP synthase F1 subunit delta [Bacteroidia bacterium]